MGITIKNLHKDLPEDQLHEAKGFTTASNNTYLKKNQDGSSEWLAEYWLEPVLGVVTGASAPPTESTGHRYILTGSSFDAGWDSPSQHEIVEFDGTNWVGIAAVDGMRVVDLSDDSVYYFNTAWNQVTDANTDTTYTISAVDSGDDAIIRLTAGGSGSGDDDITLVAGTGMTITPSGDNITLEASGGTSAWTTSGSDIYYNTGKVGIGLTSGFGGSLHVKGTGNTNATTSFLVESTSKTLMRLYDSGDSIRIGANAGFTSGNAANISIGSSACFFPSGANNVSIGNGALTGTSTGNSNGNVAIGHNSLNDVVDARTNVAIGQHAGHLVTGGDRNTIIGGYAGDNLTTGSDNIIIGYNVDASSATVENELRIGDQIVGNMDSAGDRYTKFLGQVYTETASLSGTGVTIDWFDSNVKRITLSGTTTFNNPQNLKDGATYVLIIHQPSGANYTASFGSVFKWEGGTAPTLTATNGATDILTFVSDGTNLYGVAAQNFS